MTKQELELKHDKFVVDFNNKFIKVLPNNYPPQCFDQAVKWTDLLGVPHFAGNPSPFPYPNAYQIYTDFGVFQKQYFDRIDNTPDYIPQKGDIIIWAGSYNGGIGHVATATGIGDINTFQAFSQNVPLNSNTHLVTFNYNHVLGALRYKTSQIIIDKRPGWFDLLSKTEFGNTGWEKLTDEQVNKWIKELPDRKVAGGKWDLLCDKLKMPHNSTMQQVFDKLGTGKLKTEILEVLKKY